ncbi:MAG: hypothetical protein NVSMB1_07580 [Polyangiales bacterium]
MALETIRLSTVIPASAERIYRAWLRGREHSAFTGGKATISSRVGGRFTAWNGYIVGRTVELVPSRKIVQTWRTAEFPEESEDSRLEVVLDPASGGTRLTLLHSAIPEGQSERYRRGWLTRYFAPMKKYFERDAGLRSPTRNESNAAKAEVPAPVPVSSSFHSPTAPSVSTPSYLPVNPSHVTAAPGLPKKRAAAPRTDRGKKGPAARSGEGENGRARKPTRARRGARIAKDKYDAVAAAILAVVPRGGDGFLSRDLPDAVAARLPKQFIEKGSVSWYTNAVKVDLENRGMIERVEGSKPQRLVRKK